MLMEAFFLVPPMPESPNQQEPSRPQRGIKVLHQITIQEVTKAIFASNPKKAARMDSLTFKVWQEL
jgi:hypothetical protein